MNIIKNKNMIYIMLVLIVSFTVIGCSTTKTVPPTTTPSNALPGNSDVGSSGSNSNAVKELRIESYNFGLKATGPQINKGDKVKLILTSTSGTHGVAIPSFNVITGAVSPGEEKVVEFTADQSGTFDYYCNVLCGSGHRSMKGTFTVN